MGSDNDYPVVKAAGDFFDKMGVGYRMKVSSAHRSPVRTEKLISEAEAEGVLGFICAAGMSAHLAGVTAAQTTKPVIGIPIDASPMGGMDALLSTVQMPPGVPVATVAVGKAGATNAAVLACQIIALTDPELARRLVANKGEMAEGVEKKDAKLAEAMRG